MVCSPSPEVWKASKSTTPVKATHMDLSRMSIRSEKAGVGVDLRNGACVYFAGFKKLACPTYRKDADGDMVETTIPEAQFFIFKFCDSATPPFSNLVLKEAFTRLSTEERIFVLGTSYRREFPREYALFMKHTSAHDLIGILNNDGVVLKPPSIFQPNQNFKAARLG